MTQYTASRDSILSKIKQNQPDKQLLPDLSMLGQENFGIQKFKETLAGIGGNVIDVSNYEEIIDFVQNNYDGQNQRIISTVQALTQIAKTNWDLDTPNSLQNVDLAILEGSFGVAENGAIWLNENQMGQRVTPFICQYLAIILSKKDIVPTMHQAYQRIAKPENGFGVFIAGPSKTADIEQSLVLGAHGARGLVVFLM
jgi:L-lactate dehydrogenase complex protein LldG